MDIYIDITKNLIEQFARSMRFVPVGDELRIHPEIGTNNALIKYLEFPGHLELYHFGLTRFKFPINMKSVNPDNTDWFLIHINLSKVRQVKVVDGEQIVFQKHLPIGTLLYGSNLEITTRFPLNVESEVASIRFSKAFLNSYFGEVEKVIDMNKNIVYEDLDTELETILASALNAMQDKIRCHSLILAFLKRFFDKLNKREEVINSERIHP